MQHSSTLQRTAGLARTSFQPISLPANKVHVSSPVQPRSLIQQGQLLCAVSRHVQQPLAHAQEEQVLNQIRSGGISVMAAMTSSAIMGSEGEVYAGLAKAVDVYQLILTVRILATWFKSINWYNEPFNTLKQFTDPFLNVFRGIIPPIGGMDLSIMIGFFLLGFVKRQLHRMAMGLGVGF